MSFEPAKHSQSPRISNVFAKTTLRDAEMEKRLRAGKPPLNPSAVPSGQGLSGKNSKLKMRNLHNKSLDLTKHKYNRNQWNF
jgi:hypothetical protein